MRGGWFPAKVKGRRVEGPSLDNGDPMTTARAAWCSCKKRWIGSCVERTPAPRPML